MDETKPTFEESLKKLEQIVTEMESGQLSLDGMMEHFEKGRLLAKACQDDLNAIQQRIEKVVSADPTAPAEETVF